MNPTITPASLDSLIAQSKNCRRDSAHSPNCRRCKRGRVAAARGTAALIHRGET